LLNCKLKQVFYHHLNKFLFRFFSPNQPSDKSGCQKIFLCASNCTIVSFAVCLPKCRTMDGLHVYINIIVYQITTAAPAGAAAAARTAIIEKLLNRKDIKVSLNFRVWQLVWFALVYLGFARDLAAVFMILFNVFIWCLSVWQTVTSHSRIFCLVVCLPKIYDWPPSPTIDNVDYLCTENKCHVPTVSTACRTYGYETLGFNCFHFFLIFLLAYVSVLKMYCLLTNYLLLIEINPEFRQQVTMEIIAKCSTSFLNLIV